MPFQPVTDCALVELIYDMFDQTAENTLYFRDLDGGFESAANLAILAEAVAGWWEVEIAPLQGIAVTLREVKATYLGVETGPQATFPVASPGLNTSGALPSNVALCVSLRTAMLGRSRRGRNYFLGLVENQLTGNTVASGTITLIAAAYASLPDYLTIALDPAPTWVVVSRFSLGVERPYGIMTPVTNVVIVDDQSDSMRRRLTGRGE